MLGKIVVDHYRVLAFVAEVFAHGAGRVGGKIKHGRRLGGRGGDDNGVIHGTVILELLHHLRDRRALLADGAVDTNKVVALAVDDGVQRDRGFSSLPVADDQLTLAAADGNHRVDGFDSGGHGFANRLALDHPRSNSFDRNVLAGRDGTFVVDRQAQGVHHTADHAFAGRHGHDFAGAFYLAAFFDLGVLAHDHHADLVFFQVHGDSGNAVA